VRPLSDLPNMSGLSIDDIGTLVRARDLCEKHSKTNQYAKNAYGAVSAFMRHSYLEYLND
jgi:hypothetical protein